MSTTPPERTYTVGIPLAVTFLPDGTFVLDFDLAEVGQDMEPVETYDDSIISTDAAATYAVLSTLRNHFALTLNSPA